MSRKLGEQQVQVLGFGKGLDLKHVLLQEAQKSEIPTIP